MAWAAAFLFLSACGDGIVGDAGGDEPDPWSDEETAWLTEDDVPYTPRVGEPVSFPDPFFDDEPGVDDDAAPADEGDPSDPAAPSDPVAPAEPNDPASTPQPAFAQGDILLVLRYAKLRQQPNAQSAVVAVHTNGGAHGGHPKGVVPPGSEVRVLAQPYTNGHYRVQYKGHGGWMHDKNLALFDTAVHPVTFAKRASVRNAFFMHQIRRSRWNKDGPYSSANCAPTSLAMAAKIFGHLAPDRTVEQSIHQARSTYDPAPLCETCGTNRLEIRRGAEKLGLHARTLGAIGDTETRMNRLETQLSMKRVVVLEGEPSGQPGQAYRQRMTHAYAANGVSRSYTYQGKHSILVVGKLQSGNFLVADPLSEVGMVAMSRSELKSFFRSWGGTGNALW
ncbi:MAG: hypothetical protein JRI23_02680 [Deltaproteobacteria bacterium]|nr:hypothetical protein [Deltaproteobacteria bacterium]